MEEVPISYPTLSSVELNPIVDLDQLDDLLAALAEESESQWSILSSELAANEQPATPDEFLEYLIKADTLIRRSAEQENPFVLWVDDLQLPGVVRIGAFDARQQEEHAFPILVRPVERESVAVEDVPESSKKSFFSWWKRSANESPKPSDAILNRAAAVIEARNSSSAGASEGLTSEQEFSNAMHSCNRVLNGAEEIDRLMSHMHSYAADGWYVYRIGDEPPSSPLDTQEMHRFLLDFDASLQLDMNAANAGIVLVDNPKMPEIVKIYHPAGGEEGTGCALPVWIISLAQPELLDTRPPRTSRWRSLFHLT